MRKDCSFLSFEEELEMGEYVMEEADEIKYKKEILEEMNEINKELNIRFNCEIESYEVLKSLQKSSRLNCKKLRKKGTYQLHGIVVHSGSSTGGHYYTYIRKYKDNDDTFVNFNKGGNNCSNLGLYNNQFSITDDSFEWWCFDDEKVREVSWEKYGKVNILMCNS
jgi:adenylate cyclase class IV